MVEDYFEKLKNIFEQESAINKSRKHEPKTSQTQKLTHPNTLDQNYIEYRALEKKQVSDEELHKILEEIKDNTSDFYNNKESESGTESGPEKREELYEKIHSAVVDKKVSITLFLAGLSIFLINATNTTGNAIGTQSSNFNAVLFLAVVLFVTGLVGLIAFRN
jgi:arsenate reductase-like glutaredoxin family protein